METLLNSARGVGIAGWAGLVRRGPCRGLLGALAWCVLFGISPQAQALCSGHAAGIPNACLWLKADDGASTISTTGGAWLDRSGNGKDLRNGVTFLPTEASPDLLTPTRSPARPPNLIAGSATTGMNFNPVVRFDGAYQRVALKESTIGTNVSEITLFFVTRERHRQVTVPFYHWYRGTLGEARVSIHWAWSDDNRIYWDRGICCGVPAGRSWANAPFGVGVANLGLTTYSVTNNRADLVVNAKTLDVQEPSPTRFSTINLQGTPTEPQSSLTVLGAWYDGDIPELLEFKRDLSDGERTRVQSYLALKYGLTLDPNGLKNNAYTSGGDVPVYRHSDYPHNIIGIGHDSVTGLNQRVARSTQKMGTANPFQMVKGDSPLTIATTLDFTSANGRHRSELRDGQYLVLGDNDGDVATLGDATAEQFGKRIGRVWRAQNTGGVGAVHLGFDPTLLETNFPADKRGFLLVSTDADFSVANTTRYALGHVTVGGKAVFTPVTDIGSETPKAVTIPDGSYITLGQESVCTGTALGIADACLWLKANDGGLTPGGTVSTWPDRSESQKNLTGVGNPSVVAGSNTTGMNFNPVVRFNGVDQTLVRNESTIGTNASEINVFFVSRENARQESSVFSHSNLHEMHLQAHWPWGPDKRLYWDKGICCDDTDHRDRSIAPFEMGVASLGLVTNSVVARTAEIIANAKKLDDDLPPSPGLPITGNFLSTTRVGSMRIGEIIGEINNRPFWHHGDIPEFLEFKRNLDATQRTRVQSYLALKYGLTLDRTGLGNAYTSGSDRAVYSDGGYWHSIIGIGRDELTTLDQRVSRSTQKIGTGDLWVAPGDSPLTLATPKNDGIADFTSANPGSRTELGDGQYLVLGDNNGALTLDPATKRLRRVWRAQNTGAVGPVYLGFDADKLNALLADERYSLLVSTDANFGVTNTTSYALGRVTLGGADVFTPVTRAGSATSVAVTIPNNAYITLGQYCDGTALGITDACVWLRADAGVRASRDWADQSGMGNTAAVNGTTTMTTMNFNPAVSYSGGAGHTFAVAADVTNRYTFLGVARLAGTRNQNVFTSLTGSRLFGYWNGSQNAWQDRQWHLFNGTPAQTQPMLYTLRRAGDTAARFSGNGLTLLDKSVHESGVYRMTLANGGPAAAGEHSDVSIPEFFSFKRPLDDAEIDRIESYLALKYGLTLGRAADPKNYVNSANQAVWTANRGVYQHRVFGLGRDGGSQGLDQRVAKSQESDALLTLATKDANPDFTSANPGSRTELGVGQYLVLGDNDGTLTALSADAWGRSHNRLPRVWRAQNTRGVGPVFLGLEAAKVNFTNTGRYRLFVESGAGADGSFPVGRTSTYVLSNALSGLTGYWVPVADGAAVAVNIPDGAYLSYGTLAEPQLSLSVQSRGGTGTFGFSGTNGFVASSAATEVEMQPALARPATQTLSAPDADIVITVAMPAAGWSLETASCIDRQAATSGNPRGAVLGRVSAGDQFTIPAAQAKASADLHCTFVVRYDLGSTLNTISGRVFIDNGAGGSDVANDGHINGAEAGRSGVALRLTDCGATTHAFASSSGDGSYSLQVPRAARNGTMCVEQTLTDDYRVTQGGLDASGLDASGVMLDTTAAQRNRWRFAYAGASVQNLHIGNVPSSRLLVDGTRVGIAGSTVEFPHRLLAGTAGTLTFGVSDASPAASGWSEVLYRDLNCNAQLDASDTFLGGGLMVVADASVCVIVRQFVPAGLHEGATRQFQLQAALKWANVDVDEALTNRDHTTVGDQPLRLYKEVRNVTTRGEWTTYNSAKPGETLEYRITFTNSALEPISDLVIHSATPQHTTLVSAECPDAMPTGMACEPLSSTASPPTRPADGGTGPLRWHFTGPLSGGASGAVKYQVKVNE